MITRDPLDWIPDRGTGWDTSNGSGDNGDLELPIYVTLEEVQRRLALRHRDSVAALGPLSLGLLTNRVYAGYPEPMRYAGVTMCLVFLLGLAALPFAPENKGRPLPE